jgi:phage/plasmid-like protein (TIGR03299 family)
MHEMTQYDQMFSVREAPWHLGRGTNVLMLDRTPETRMARMELAGQAWTVEEQDVFTGKSYGEGLYEAMQYARLPGWKLLTRSDTGTELHVARDSYEVVQNVVGHELFEALSEGADLEDGTGGTTQSGKTCYLTARVNEPTMVNGDTTFIYPYVVVTWAHDGSGSIQARRTSVRVVCQNTVSYSEMDAKRSGRNFTFRHTAKVMERIAEAKEVISGARADTAEFIELANELAAINVTDAQREQFVLRFVPAPAAQVISDRVLDNINEARDKVRGIFDSPTIPEAHRNTAYGLVQAGVEYLDHLRGYRNSDTYLGRTLLRDEPLKAKLVPMVRELVKA